MPVRCDRRKIKRQGPRRRHTVRRWQAAGHHLDLFRFAFHSHPSQLSDQLDNFIRRSLFSRNIGRAFFDKPIIDILPYFKLRSIQFEHSLVVAFPMGK
jgi:hypothetical protein